MLCPCGAGRLNAESFGTPKENARYGINESEDANDNCWNMRRQRQLNEHAANGGVTVKSVDKSKQLLFGSAFGQLEGP